MSSFLQLLLVLVCILLAAKISGALAVRFHMPSILGELLAGVILGPTFLNLLAIPIFQSASLHEIVFDFAELGVILIMFIAGLESDFKKLREVGWAAALAGTLGVITPLVLGYGVALLFGYSASTAAFIGIILTATSVTITAETLRELGALKGRVGSTLLGAAVFDDVLGLLTFSLFLTVNTSSTTGAFDIIFTLGRMILFLGAGALFGWYLIPRLANWVSKWSLNVLRKIDEDGNPLVENEPHAYFMLVMALSVGLAFAWSSEVIGSLAGITGAYLAGLFISRTSVREMVLREIKGLVYGFFAPIFFIGIGLQVNGRVLELSLLPFALTIAIVAIVAKIVGCGFGAKLGRMTTQESFQIGVGMISRGEVGLIIASIGITMGIIKQDIFVTTVAVVLITTLATPILLAVVFKRKPSSQSLTQNKIHSST